MKSVHADQSGVETLLQIHDAPVWDGNIVSKSCRNDLYNLGWITRHEGWNLITDKGRAAVQYFRFSFKTIEINYASQSN